MSAIAELDFTEFAEAGSVEPVDPRVEAIQNIIRDLEIFLEERKKVDAFLESVRGESVFSAIGFTHPIVLSSSNNPYFSDTDHVKTICEAVNEILSGGQEIGLNWDFCIETLDLRDKDSYHIETYPDLSVFMEKFDARRLLEAFDAEYGRPQDYALEKMAREFFRRYIDYRLNSKTDIFMGCLQIISYGDKWRNFSFNNDYYPIVHYLACLFRDQTPDLVPMPHYGPAEESDCNAHRSDITPYLRWHDIKLNGIEKIRFTRHGSILRLTEDFKAKLVAEALRYGVNIKDS